MSAGHLDVGRLKIAMGEANLDQSALARKLDVTPGAINQILTGRTKRSRLMPAIAGELGVSLRWLMTQSDDKTEGGPSLPPDERHLLTKWRRLSWEQREAVLAVIETMGPPPTVHTTRHEFRGKEPE